MEVKLSFGRTGLTVRLPDEWEVAVIEPRFVEALPNPTEALQTALQNPISASPLCDLVSPSDSVGIVFSDVTRPTPNHLILPAVLDELTHVHRSKITLFAALGTHRRNTRRELKEMLGKELVDAYRIVQNNAFDASTHVWVGTSSQGHGVWLNKDFVACEVKILTGFIEPHLFAGFSGGPKAVLPGMAALETVLHNHDPGMVSHARATWGVIDGNPMWQEMREAAYMIGPSFLVNVAMNREKALTAVFAGDLDAAHRRGCTFVRETAMVAVPHPFDIVITSNSGYPLDLNLYQAVKGMSAAAQVVRQGGAIIIAADCWDGIPEHGRYGEMLRRAGSPQGVLEMINAPGFLEHDQWQAQVQAQVQLKADVYVRSDNLSDQQITSALLLPCRSIEDTAGQLVAGGTGSRVCVLPEGPQVVGWVPGKVPD